MARILQKHLNKVLEEYEWIVRIYREKYSKETKRDWRTYEQRLALRIRNAAKELSPLIKEACSQITVIKGKRKQRKLPLEKKILALLLKDIFQLSNRKFANMLALFSALTGVDVSYKTIERIYSDELIKLAIHNLFVLLIKKKGIKSCDACGDGTGYSLTITKHYRSEREKELKGKKVKKSFVYVFSLMDLDSKMYVGYGSSMKSEREAYEKARKLAQNIGITFRSVRLDKLYSNKSITKEFGNDTAIYIIPKRNATIRGNAKWKEILKSFIEDPFSYLQEYYRRNNSESGYSCDKRLSGWKVWQKKEERIEVALMCKAIWHNLMLLY